MSDDETPSEWDYGFYSNEWLLKMLLIYVPRSQLNVAIVSLIDRLIKQEEDDEDIDVLDHLAQVAATGKLIYTKDYVSPYYDVENNPAMSEDEIEKLTEEFSKILKQMPSAEDPEEGGQSA